MPILGPLAVIKRVEDVMQERFALVIRQVEADLVTDGSLLLTDPVAPVPADDEYFRQEEGSFEARVAVVVRANESSIINEITNMGDIHWQHELVVEMHKVLDGTETFEQLQSMIYRYGAALVRLFGAERPSLELGGAQMNDGFAFPNSAAGQGFVPWPDAGNVLLSDDVRAVATNRGSTNILDALFTLSDFLPDQNVQVVGIEVQCEGFCNDADPVGRSVDVLLLADSTPFLSDKKTVVLREHVSDDGFISAGGAGDLWGLEYLDPADWWGVDVFKVRLSTSAGAFANLSMDAVRLKVYYKVPAQYDGTTIIGVGPVKYRDRFDEAGAFINRSATITLEVQRREING